jgi:hypothetical protein
MSPAKYLFLRGFCLLPLAGVLITGCSKKEIETQPQPPAPPPTASAPATPLPATAPRAAAQNTEADARLKEAQVAQRAHDYEKAAETLLALQQQRRLSDQQAAALGNQMRLLQRDLAGAIANGDPKAKAAADKLRAAASGQ